MDNFSIPICSECGRTRRQHGLDHPFIAVGGGEALGSYLDGFSAELPQPPKGRIGRIILCAGLLSCAIFWVGLASWQGWI